MNILFVTPYFPPQTGGVATYLDNLRALLSKRGHDVYVLKAGATDKLTRLPGHADGRVFELYMRQLSWNTGFLRSLLACLVYLIPTFWQILSFIRSHQIELVSLEYPLPYMFYFRLVRWWTPVRVMVGLHGSDVMLYPKLPPLDRWSVRGLVRTADWVLAHSSSLLAHAVEIIGRLPSGRSYLPCWVDMEQLRQQAAQPPSARAGEWKGRKYVLTVAKLYPRKGLDVLLKAIASVDPAYPHVFLIAGDGPEEESLRELAKTLGIAHRVVFLGYASHADIPSLVQGCEFFVLPSRSEPFGIVLLEAMTFGKAVIATNVGGIPEFIVDGDSGFLVPSEDSEALAQRISLLLDDAGVRHRLGAGALRAVAGYDTRAVSLRYERLFQSVIAGDTTDQRAHNAASKHRTTGL